MYKKITSVVLAFCLVIGISAAADNYKIEYPWAAEAIEYCIDNNILNGDGYGNYMLSEKLTQSQCLALINRTFDVSPKYGKIPGPYGHWAEDDIDCLSGYLLRPDDFSADAPATREMFISTLIRISGIEFNYNVAALKNLFLDYGAIYPEYLIYLATGVLDGYVYGDGGRLRPKDFITRAEAITVIYRVRKAKGLTVKPSMDIMGTSQVDIQRAKAWARRKGGTDAYIDVAEFYWKYGELTGIRPEVLYAQAGKETGYGRYGGRVLPEMNNWAGIKKYGATGDATEDHEVFETPEDGVRGHFNHMSAYVGIKPIGETHGRYKSVKTLSWAGTIKDVAQLGGTWCPSPTYGYEIIALVEEMS